VFVECRRSRTFSSYRRRKERGKSGRKNTSKKEGETASSLCLLNARETGHLAVIGEKSEGNLEGRTRLKKEGGRASSLCLLNAREAGHLAVIGEEKNVLAVIREEHV